MAEQYEGTCPICGVSLIVSAGNRLRCPDPTNHFLCSRQDFERIWDAFERGGPSSWDEDAVEGLVVKLKDINLLEVADEVPIESSN